jgi:hypothetical protein
MISNSRLQVGKRVGWNLFYFLQLRLSDVYEMHMVVEYNIAIQ